MSLKVPKSSPHNMFKKYIVKETQFLIDILVENGHKRTFLKNVVKNHNTKEKNNDSLINQVKEISVGT